MQAEALIEHQPDPEAQVESALSCKFFDRSVPLNLL